VPGVRSRGLILSIQQGTQRILSIQQGTQRILSIQQGTQRILSIQQGSSAAGDLWVLEVEAVGT